MPPNEVVHQRHELLLGNHVFCKEIEAFQKVGVGFGVAAQTVLHFLEEGELALDLGVVTTEGGEGATGGLGGSTVCASHCGSALSRRSCSTGLSSRWRIIWQEVGELGQEVGVVAEEQGDFVVHVGDCFLAFAV